MTTFDETVELIKVVQVGKDKYKNPITEKVATEVFCNEKSITRDEFYKAGVQSLKPSYILVIHEFEYEEEQKVIYKGKELDVIKTYPVNDYIELTVGEKLGN